MGFYAPISKSHKRDSYLKMIQERKVEQGGGIGSKSVEYELGFG